MAAPDRQDETPEAWQAEFAFMCQSVVEMAAHARNGFAHQDEISLQAAEDLGRAVSEQEKLLVKRLTPAAAVAGWARRPDPEGIFIPLHLERVSDCLQLFSRAVRKKMLRDGVLFTARARHEILTLLDRALEILECVRDALRTGNRALVRHVLDESERYAQAASEYARFHEQRLIEGVCLPDASSVYLAMIDELKGVEWHTRQVALKLAASEAGRPKESAYR